MTPVKSKNKGKTINATANDYQLLARQMKQLEAKIKPLKEELIAYAKQHPEQLDEAFQLKFPNGSYVSLRVTDVLKADSNAKEILLNKLDDEYIMETLDEKLIIDTARKNTVLMKTLTNAGAKIEQKETYAVYAG